MSEQKNQHTPGPWRADESGRDVRTGGVGGLFVARIYAVPREDNPSVYTDEQVANAHLIAAAPELLDACRTLIKYCSRRDGSLANYEDWLQGFIEDESTIIECVEKAVAAIQKAEIR